MENKNSAITQWRSDCIQFSEDLKYKTFRTISERESFLRSTPTDTLLCPEHLNTNRPADVQSVRHLNGNDLNTLFILYTKDGKELNVCKDRSTVFSRPVPAQGDIHTHDYIEIFYVISGTFSQILLNQTYTFQKGDVVITDKNCEHADIFPGKDASVLFLCVNFAYMESLLKYNSTQNELQRFLFHAISSAKQEQSFLVFSPPAQFRKNISLQTNDSFFDIEKILEQIVEEEYRNIPGSDAIINGLFVRLLFSLGNHYTMMRYADKHSGHDQLLLFELEKLIQTDPGMITTDFLEKKFHYHRNYYNHLLQKYRDKSLKTYIQEIRIKKACELLTSTDFSIKKISNMIGYENTSFFYHLFEKITGVKPKDYRTGSKSL